MTPIKYSKSRIFYVFMGATLLGVIICYLRTLVAHSYEEIRIEKKLIETLKELPSHLRKNEPKRSVLSDQHKQKRGFGVAQRGFWEGVEAVKGHVFDEKLAKGLIDFFKSENVGTILELGAGTGTYAKHLKTAGIFISCYDGNPATQDLSEGRCAVADFSKPLAFCKHEWTLSLEVGEHIPSAYEDIFIANLNNANVKGLILSWAIEGQGGTSHVNNRNNSYVREKFGKLGYASDFSVEKMLRSAATMGWFKNTIMVFRRN